jgi:hypothetical protein
MGPQTVKYIFFCIFYVFLASLLHFFCIIMFFLQYNVLFKKNYIYIYIFFIFFIYGVSPCVSIFWGPVSYRPSFENLETFPRFVQLSFIHMKHNPRFQSEGDRAYSLYLVPSSTCFAKDFDLKFERISLYPVMCFNAPLSTNQVFGPVKTVLDKEETR